MYEAAVASHSCGVGFLWQQYEVSENTFYFSCYMNEKWKKLRKIGQGGNGSVYEVADTSGNRFAMKVLEKIKFGKAYSRFKSEIEVLTKLKDKKGVIQIV